MQIVLVYTPTSTSASAVTLSVRPRHEAALPPSPLLRPAWSLPQRLPLLLPYPQAKMVGAVVQQGRYVSGLPLATVVLRAAGAGGQGRIAARAVRTGMAAAIAVAAMPKAVLTAHMVDLMDSHVPELPSATVVPRAAGAEERQRIAATAVSRRLAAVMAAVPQSALMADAADLMITHVRAVHLALAVLRAAGAVT
jgi:hypothetical protein